MGAVLYQSSGSTVDPSVWLVFARAMAIVSALRGVAVVFSRVEAVEGSRTARRRAAATSAAEPAESPNQLTLSSVGEFTPPAR